MKIGFDNELYLKLQSDNILKRMEILYHEQGSISFSNEPGMGARIDIEVLYIPYKESEKSDEYFNRG